jgi:hypothetical protein
MIKRRYIILNILLLIIVLFSSGIEVHPNSETQRHYLELASGSNNLENKLSYHIDAEEEDQMDQSHIMLLPEKPECQKSSIDSLPLLNNIFFSIWQPPKIF